MADRSIRVILRAEIAGFKRAMDEAAASTKSVGAGAEGSAKRADTALGRMVQSATRSREAWTTVGTSLTAAGGAVTAFGLAALRTGVQYNTLQQTSRAALTSLLGSAKAANAQMDKLDAFARTSPFSKQTFITAQQQMLAFGIEARKVVPYLDSIQNAVAAAGGSNDDIAAIVATMSKIQSSAKVTAEDLNEFGNRGVNAAELIGSQMGKTGAQIREDITDGALDATQALDALAAGMSQRFDGAAANVKNTFAGSLDRVKAAWRDFSAELAEPLVDPNGGGVLVSMLNGVADAMRGFIGLPDPIKKTITVLGGVGGVAATAAGGFLLLAPRLLDTIQSVRTLKADFPVASASLTGFGKAATIAAGALGVLATAGAIVKANTGDAVPGVDRMTRALEATQITANQAREAMMSVDTSTWIDQAFTAEASRGWLGLKSDMEGVADAARHLKNFGGDFEALIMGAADALGMVEDPGAKAREAFHNFDTALAQMVESGNLDAAAEGAQIVSSALLEQGFTGEQVAQILSQYDGALELHGLVSQRTAEATGELASWQETLAAQLESADPVVKAAGESMKDLLSSTSGSAEAFVDLSDDLGKATFSLGGWLSKLEEQAVALEEWDANIRALIERGASRDLMASLIEQGPAAAQAVKALANGTEDDLARAQGAFDRTIEAEERLRNAVGEAYTLNVQTGEAEAAMDGAAATAEDLGANLRPWEIVADATPAQCEAEEKANAISSMTPNFDVGANTHPAMRAGESTADWVRRLNPTMSIFANTAAAEASARSFVSSWQGRTVTVNVAANTYSASGGMPGGGTGVKRSALGGPITGGIPGKDSVPILAMPGEHMLTVKDVRALGGQAGVYALRAALHGGVLRMAKGGAIDLKGKSPAYWQERLRSPLELAQIKQRIWELARNLEEREDNGQYAYRGFRREIVQRQLKDAQRERDDAVYANRIGASALAAAAKKEADAKLAAERAASRKATGADLKLAASRGNLAGSASSGLSGAQSLVDRLLSAGEDSALSSKQQSSLTKAANSAEKSYSKLYGTLTHVTDQLDAAKERAAELQAISDQTANALSRFDLSGAVEATTSTTTNKWGETWETSTGGGKAGILAAASAYASKVKALASKIAKLVSKGFRAEVIAEVGAAGVEGGTVMADALLSMSAAEVKRLNGDYAAISAYAAQAGQNVTAAYSPGGLSAANAQVGTLTAQQQKVQGQITGLSQQLETLLLGAYGIQTRASGGPILSGRPYWVGEKGPELVVPQQSGYVIPADASRRLASVGAAGAQSVQVTLDRGALAQAMAGTTLTLSIDGQPVRAVIDARIGSHEAAQDRESLYAGSL